MFVTLTEDPFARAGIQKLKLKRRATMEKKRMLV